MTAAGGKLAALQKMVAGLSQEQMDELATTLEGAEQLNEEDELVLALLRPGLRKGAGRSHRDKVIEAFCGPFEDLLYGRDPDVKLQTRISRRSIRPVWNWLRREGGAEMDRVILAYEEALDFCVDHELESARNGLWRAAVRLSEDALEAAFSDPGAGRAMAEDLGGTRRLEDMREMMTLLAIGPEIHALKAVVSPRPVLKLGYDQATAILEGYHRVADRRPGCEAWLIIAMMRRLMHEADILQVVKSLSRDGHDTLASMTDLAVVGDAILQDIEGYAHAMERAADAPGGAGEIVKLAQEFTAAYLAVVDSLEVKREGMWGQRLLEAKKSVSAAIDAGILKTARADILPALKCRTVQSGKAGIKQADLRRDPDLEAYARAEERALAIRDVVRLGSRIGVSAAISSVTRDIVEEIQRYADSMLSQLDNVPDAYVERARSHVIMIARLMELLAGPDPAEMFYKRAFRRISGDA